MQVTDGVRDEDDGTVRNSGRQHLQPHDDLEVQLSFHDDALPPGSKAANFPPRHGLFYWINIEHVQMRVLHL